MTGDDGGGVGSHAVDVIDCIEFPILVTDRNGAIACFNPAAAAVLSLVPADVGRPIRSVSMLAAVSNLEEACEHVVRGGSSSQREMRDDAGSWFSVRIGPWRATNQDIAGAILTFTNVTVLRATLDQAISEREYTKTIINTVMDPLVVLDGELRVQAANQAFHSMFEVSARDHPLLHELGKPDWDIPRLHALLSEVHSAHRPEPLEVVHEFEHLGARTLLLNACRLSRGAHQEALTLVAIQDITTRKTAEEAVRRRTAQFETLLNKAPLGLYLVDADFRVREVNPTARAVFGDIPDLIGRDFDEVIHILWSQALADQIVERFRHTLETGEPYVVPRYIEERLDRGTREFYEWQINRIQLPEGRYGVVCYFRDITERVHAETEREQLLDDAREARKKAERALQAKDEFLATVSHELRSPLNAIVGWTHLLRAGALDADAISRAVETIHRNAQMQNQLISDILDVQRLTTGRFRLNMRDVDLALAVEAAMDTVRPAAQAKRIVLRPQLGGVPSVPGDPDRVQQIIWNLLSNAVKFTPAGGTVSVVLRPAGSGAEIVVADSGPGIRPEFLPYVFERFRQDAAGGGHRGGLGLGLAIVRNFTELHGGTVRVENGGDGGAVFTVCLPGVRSLARIDAISNLPPSEDAWREHAPSLHGTRVMIVDDEADAREMLATVLSVCGADVIVATSASDALMLLARDVPDVLVCDIEMPGQDGYALIGKVRALPESEGGAVPAAALTAATAVADRLRALRAGFQIHIPKPVQPAELATVVATLARGTRQLARRPRAAG